MSPDGKATILFDAPQSEVRALLWGGDGALYAGTATEASGGNTARGSFVRDSGGRMPRLLDGPAADRGLDAPARGGDDEGQVETVRVQAGGLAQARPAAPRPVRRRLGRSQTDHAPAITPSIDSTPTAFRAKF